MTYESFKQQLMDALTDFFPDGAQISIHSYSHNNHLLLDGITILEPDSNISPAIYLNHYFEQYKNGTSFPDIQRQILDYYHQHKPSESIDTSFFTDFEKVRSRIAYKLVHYEKNRELLKEIPHFAYLDLAIVFYCLVSQKPYENASILIYNHHLDHWNISKDALLLLAQKNTPLLLPWRCDSLANLLLSSLGNLAEERREEALTSLGQETIPMHVLTNEQGCFGACCILYPDVLKELSDKIGDDLALLPCSVHEIILLPASLAANPKELSGIVQDVNRTKVAPDETLSDAVYFYNRRSRQVALFENADAP